MKRIILILYIAIIVIQLMFFVPYSKNIFIVFEKTEPYVQCVATVYKPINCDLFKLNSELINMSRNIRAQSRLYLKEHYLYKLDIPRLLTHLLITTLIFVALYLCVYEKEKNENYKF